MPTWRGNEPDDPTKVRIADNYIRENWQVIQDAFSREHDFVGTGQHIPGYVGIIYVGPSSACSTFAPSTPEASGAICYATDLNCFLYWNGVAWDQYDYYIKSAGDTLTNAWTVSGSCIDGRDPSVDGAKLDGVATSSDYVVVATGSALGGATVDLISGFPASAHTFFVSFREYVSYNYASARDFQVSIDPETRIVTCRLLHPEFGYVNNWVNYIIVARRYTP